MESRIRSTLVWLIMAAFCGLIGVAIVYYYSSNVRPMERFAIVIDAGSTQTRSNLFKISIKENDLTELSASQDSEDPIERTPLGDLIRVQQVSSCVNGGPVASITDEKAARGLIRKCLIKFSEHIKLLDFVDAQSKLHDEEDDEEARLGNYPMDADDVSKQMALINHRVNSITHLHLGATAGMRALGQLNSSRTQEKLAWMKEAISQSNSMLSDNSPYINRGYVGILTGADEASFGWLSVNFVCDTLNASVAGDKGAAFAEPSPRSVDRGAHQQSSNVIYALGGREGDGGAAAPADSHTWSQAYDREPLSVGTLELGGASAQMAYQVTNNLLGSERVVNMNIEEQQLDLFNGHYKLATRSDLCLGMSQAVLRANYILLHKTMHLSSGSNLQSPVIKIVNACMQRGASIKLTGFEIAKIWQGACLVANEKLAPSLVERDRSFRLLVGSKESIEFVGSGNVDQCNLLLSDLIEPALCGKYFSLCPPKKNRMKPPGDMPFVTISGYNHAMNVLNLEPNKDELSPGNDSARWGQLENMIDDKLGGNSISYNDLLQKTREFCSTQVSDVPKYYPKTNKQYQNIICLQLVYIRKLLTEFYHFDPLTNWSQIKFLVFSPKSVTEQYTRVESTTSKKGGSGGNIVPDIGWTLGLLLNVTSEQLSSGDTNYIYYHHGATVMYIIRAVILIMLACFLIAITLLVVGIIEIRLAQARGDAYISHRGASSSSYDIRTIGEMANKQHPNESFNTSDGLVRSL